MCLADDVGEGFVDTEQALRYGGLRWRRDGPEVEGFVAVAVGAQKAPAGTREGGVDAEDGYGAAQLDPPIYSPSARTNGTSSRRTP